MGFAAIAPTAPGAVVYWNSAGTGGNIYTGAGLGGNGNWDTTNSFWLASDGTTFGTWNNTNNDTAVFWGTAGTVTLTEPITVGGLTFNTTGYTLTTGANTLTFGATNNAITLNRVAAATITGTVAGTGNVLLAGGSSGGQTVGTLTFNGTSTGGWSGTTTVNNGMTMALAGSSQALLNTSSIALNGGAITLTNTSAAEAALNRINNAANIAANAGTLTVTNTVSATTAYSEQIGAVTVNSGRFNIAQTNANTGGTQVLLLGGLTQSGTGSAAIFGGGGLNTGTNRVNNSVFGSATPAGQIIGPWLVTGTGAATCNDYAVYDASGNFLAAAIAASAETTWTNAANAYTFSGATTLTATRNITALRYTGAANTLTLATGANLGTTGILNGGSGTLTIAPGAGGVVTLPSTTSANLYVSASNGQGITISAPINDNGAGVLTLVNTGTNTTTLSATTSTYSGGTVLNGGTVSVAADTNLGVAGTGITFNNSATLTQTAQINFGTRTITLNNGALATITSGNIGGPTFAGKITGTGGLITNLNNGTAARTFALSNTANDFWGPISITGNATTGRDTVVAAASLADSANANGAIRLNVGGSASVATFQWSAAATSPLTLNYRQVDLAGTTGTGEIDNSNATAANCVTINTDLLISGTGNKTLQLGGTNTGANTFAGLIYDGAGSVISLLKSDAGSWTVSNLNNSFTGGVKVNNGTLTLAAINSVNTLALGSTTNTGTLAHTGAGLTFNGAFTMTGTTGGGALDSSGSGIINLTNTAAVTGGAGAKTLTLKGTNTGNNTIAGILQDNGGATTVTKSGVGTWVLPANNTYTGATNVNGGTLVINGAFTGSSATTVAAAGTLAGTGTIVGTLAVNGTVAPGSPGAGNIGTFNVNNAITFNAGGVLNVDFNPGASAFDLLSTNTLPVSSGSTTVNVNAMSPLSFGQTYTLVSGYTGTMAANNFSPGTLTGDASHSLVAVLNNSGSLQVLVGAATPSTAYWAGDRDALWNSADAVTVATNWRTAATGDVNTFAVPGTTTDVHFATTTPAAANLATTLGQNFSIKTLTFDSAISTPVSISGNSLTITPSAATDGIAVNTSTGGAVTISSAMVLGAAQTWTNNNTTDALTVNGAVSGSSPLTLVGPGAIVLGGASSNSGGVTIKSGTVTGTTTTAFGTGTITLGDTGGTANVTLLGGVAGTIANPINVPAGSSGTATITDTAATIFSGAVTLNKALAITPATSNITLSGGFTGTGNLTIATSDVGATTLSTNSVNPIGTITNNGSGSGTTTISAVVGANVTGIFQDSATSILALSGNSTSYLNGITVRKGILQAMTNGGALGGTGNLVNLGLTGSSDSATLQLKDNVTYPVAVTVASGSGARRVETNPILTTGTPNISGLLTLNNDLTVYNSTTVTTGSLTFSGGVAGTGNLILDNNASTTGKIIFSTAAINMTGNITNVGTSATGAVTLSGGIGSNVGTITQNSATPMTISTNALTVKSTGTTLVYAGGGGLLTVSGGVTGTGNLILNNNGTLDPGITLSTTAVNHTGTINNSGSGTGGVTISAAIGANVTGITQNSATSAMTLSGVIGMTGTSSALTTSNGTLIIAGTANTFPGPVSVSGANAILQVNTNTSTTSSGPLGFVDSTHFKTVNISNGATFRINSSWNFNGLGNATQGVVLYFGTGGGSIDVPGTFSPLLDDGTTTGDTGTAEYIQNASGVTSTTVNKTGTGTLTLAKQNLFNGAFNINAGLVKTTGADTLGTATTTVSVASGAALDVNGQTHTRTNPLTLAGTGLASNPQGALLNSSGTAATFPGPITIAAGGATIGTAGANLTVSGVISGSGPLTIFGTGAGAYVPNMQSTYSGGTTFTANSITVPQQSSTGAPGSVTSGPFGTGMLTFLPTSQIRSTTGTAITVNNDVTLNGGITFATASPEKNITLGGPVTLINSNAVITSNVGNSIPGTVATLAGAIGDGGNAYSLTKAGTGNLILGGANSYTGGTIVNAGYLGVTGSLANNTTLSAATGTTLTFINNAQNTPANVSALTLGNAAGTMSVGLDLGTASDSLVTAAAVSATGTINFHINAASGFGPGTYTLISAASGLSGATYGLGTMPGGYSYAFNNTDSLIRLQVSAAASGSYYWRGDLSASWTTASAGNTNWYTDAAGTTNAQATPGPSNTVVSSTSNATGPSITTTVDNYFTINALQFSAAPAGVTAVTINPGVNPGTMLPGTLAITPSSSSAGITVAQGAGAVTIAAPIVLGAPQTWSVDSSTPGSGTASSLTVSGAISGSNSLTFTTTAGTAPIILSSTGSTYNGGSAVSASTIVQGGAANAFSPNTAWTIDGTLNTGAFNQATGSLAGGSGTVQNGSATNAVLTIGSDSLATTTFGGTIQNGSTGTLGITKAGTGIQILTGAYSYTGATTVNAGKLRLAGTSTGTTAVTVNTGGTLQFGSATALTSSNNVTLAGTGALDLFGNTVTIGSLTNTATNSITNTSTNTTPSTATAPGTPSGVGVYVDALIINTAATTSSIPALITDGPTRKTQIVLNNANLGATFSLTNAGNTFSGGLVLAHNATGTRLDVNAASVISAIGTGPIIIGQASTDKAGIYFPTASLTVSNPIVFNTGLGTDRFGIRSDVAGTTLSGLITANSDAVFSSNATTGTMRITNKITGPAGLVLDVSQTSTANTVLTLTLNTAANASDYAGDTVVGRTNATPAQNYTANLTLGASNQIPNGLGKGNVVLNNNTATRTGNLNLAGFSDTINGLSGNGTVDGVSGTPTLTLGDGNATAAFSGVIKNTAGTLTLTKIGNGTQTFSGASTFTGPINANGGLIAFATSPATSGPLGNSTVVNLNGGGISYTGTTTNALNRTAAIGAANGTIDVASSLGTLTVATLTSSGGNLVKTGGGVLQLTNATTLNGGAAGVIVNGGTLQGGYGTGGIGSINVGAQGNLSFQNNLAETLTLGAAGTNLTLASGAKLGFELDTPSTSDRIVYNVASVSPGSMVTLNFFGLSGLAAGSYTLLTSSTSGGLTGVNFALGSAPNGFNYTINNDNTTVTLTTTAITSIYWRGGQNLSWNTLGASPANWTTDSAGLVDSGHKPLSTETVIFSAANAPMSGTTITTTLDAAFTVEGVQFTASPAGITAVTINPGTGGTLTISPSSSSGGLRILTGAGNATIAAPLTVGAAQTWDVADASSNLAITGGVAFNANVNKSGIGTVTLSGAGTGSGSFTLTGGTLNINHATALGGGTFAINAGTTIDNTSAGAIAMTANNPINVNGDFTFTGTKDLDLGAGAVTLSNNPTITTAAGVLTFGGAMGGSTALTKAGAGALVLGGNNSYSGATTVNAGTLTLNGNNTTAGGVTLNGGALNLGNAGALGTGPLVINSGTIDNTSGVAMTNANNNAITVNGSFTFTGSNDLNLGTGAITFTTTPTITTTTAGKTMTLGNSLGGTFGLTKAGAGNLTLSGANTYSGATTVTGGAINVTGSIIYPFMPSLTVQGGAALNVSGTITGNPAATALAYGTTAGASIVNVTGGSMTLFATQGASIANAVSVYNQTGGTVTVSPGTGNSQYVVKNVANTYGYFSLTGGTYKNTNRFDVTSAANTGLTSVGAVFVGGSGVLDNTNGEWFINGYGLNTTTVATGGTIDRTGATARTGIFMDSTVSGGAYGVINIAGGTFTQTTAAAFAFGNSTTAGSGNTGYLNVAGGTLNLGGGVITSVPASPAIVNNAYINFLGGSIKATANGNLVPATTTGINVIATIFGNTVNNGSLGPTFSGGLSLNTNGFAVTAASPLAGATGVGVTQADMTVAGGSGYVGAPVVQFSTAGVVAGGTPAQGYAVLDGSGHVAGIVLTDPGTYTAGTIPTITLTGGGGTGASITVFALSTANTQGGLTLSDTSGGTTGNLILSAANTFTAPTSIGPGAKLTLGAGGTTGSLSTSSTITIGAGGTFAVNRTNAVVQGTDFTSTPLSGDGAVLVTGATGSLTLNVANNYAGGTTVAGTTAYLIAANNNALGSGALNLKANPGGAGVTFQLSGGVTIANPIAMDSTTGREAISSTNGSNTLSGDIVISAATANANTLILTNDGAASTTFTVNSNITAPLGYTGTISLRGSSATDRFGILNGQVNAPDALFDNNVGGIWTINSTGNIWKQTQMNSTVVGSGLVLGANNALATGADVLWSTTGVGTLNLNGKNQTVAGLAATLAGASITNNGSADSILTLSNLTAGAKNFTGAITDGTTNKIFLVLDSAGKTQALSGTNTYTGATTITAGTLQLGNAGTTGSLSTSSAIDVAAGGTFAVNRTDAVVQGTAFSSNMTGSGTFQQAGTGSTQLIVTNVYGPTSITAGTLIVGDGATAGTLGTGAIANAGTLQFNHTDTYTLTAANLVTGTGAVALANSGTVAVSIDNQFNTTGALILGAPAGSATVANLDLTNGSSTFGGLLVQTSNTAANVITIGSGKTLAISGTGNFDVKTPTAGGTTRLNVTGPGTLAVNTTGNFLMDAAAVSPVANIVDLSGLATFNAAFTDFTVGAGNGTAIMTATLTLAVNNSITVSGNLRVGRSNNGQGGTSATMYLGQTNVSNVGTAGVSGWFVGTDKANATLAFNSGLTAPTLTIRGSAGGTSAADWNIGVQNVAGTGTNIVANVLLTAGAGRSEGSIDAILGTLKIGEGGLTSGAGTGTGTLEYDAGTITAASVILGSNPVGNSGNSAGTLNLKGGALNAGGIVLSQKLGTATAPAGTLNLTGGVATLSGNISDGGGVSTLLLDGATLDMGGFRIGDATNVIDTLTIASGTVKNVLEINGGAAISKTTAGTLILEGNNGYSGATNINSGVLNIRSANALGATSAGTVVADLAALEIQGGIVTAAEGLTLNGTGIGNGGALRNVLGDNTFSGPINLATPSRINSDNGTLTLTGGITGAGQNLTIGGNGNVIVSGAIATTTGQLTKDGSGTLTLSASNSYTGDTYVNGGTLVVNGSQASGGAYHVVSGAMLGGTGTIGANVSIASGGFLSPGNSPGVLSITGNVTQFGTLLVEIDAGAPTAVDLLNVGGAYDISSATVNFNVLNGPLSGDYVFASYGSLTGSKFASELNVPNGYAIDYTYGPTDHQIALVPVPEPGTLAGMAMLGLAGAVGWWRRQRRRLRRAALRHHRRKGDRSLGPR